MSIVYALIAVLVLMVIEGVLVGVNEHRAGAAEVQVQWDADMAKITAEAVKAKADADAEVQAALTANQGIRDDDNAKIAAINAANSGLALGLRRASCPAAGSGSLPKASGQPGSAPAGEASGAGPVDDAIAAAITECRINSAQLDALSAEIKPQL